MRMGVSQGWLFTDGAMAGRGILTGRDRIYAYSLRIALGFLAGMGDRRKSFTFRVAITEAPQACAAAT